MTTAEHLLRPFEAEVVDKLYKLFSSGISEMGEIWGEKPTLHCGRILFEQRRSRIIPVVEMYFVLGGQYRHGTYYKASVISDLPGRYGYEHKSVSYRLTPTMWRKTAEKRLIEILRKMITERSDEIPPRVSKLMVKEGPRSLHVLCRFLGHKAPSLGLVLTPAIEGTGLPEGFGGPASDTRTTQAAKNSCTGWLLVPPFDVCNAAQAWELVFPKMVSGVLKPEECRPLQAALLLSWLADKRGWSKMGLRNSSAAFQTLALTLSVSRDSFTNRNFREQLKELMVTFLERVKAASLSDFCVPAMNYLAGITESQQEFLGHEVDDVIRLIENTELLWETCRDYPLVLPDSVPRDIESRGGDSCDDGDSDRSSVSDHLVHGVEMDEGGGGEGAVELDSPPPLDAVASTSTKKIKKGLMSPMRTGLTQEQWASVVDGQMLSCLLMIILLAAAILFILPTFAEQVGSLWTFFGFGGSDDIDVGGPEIANDDMQDPDVPPEPSDPLLGPDDDA